MQEARDETGRRADHPVAVNPVDPVPLARAGGASPVPPSLSARTGRSDEPDVEELLHAAAAVSSVAVALARYLVTTGVRRPRSALRWVPRPALLPAARALPGGPGRLLARAGAAAADTLGSLADSVVPGLVRAVVTRIDLTALVHEFVDLDVLAAAIDVDAVVARVDIDAIMDRVDLDAVAKRLDLDAVADRIDVGRILDRVDLDGVVARVDLDKAVERVDLDRAVARVDLDRAVDRVDLDRIIERADVVGLARYVVEALDLPALIRSSTGSVTTDMVRSVRDQSVDADRAVERVVDRLLHRPARHTGPPPGQPPRGG